MNDKDQIKLEKKSNETKEKRVWIAPELHSWVSENLGLNYGVGIDGGVKSYAG
ncbi:hypothetical protein [Aquirufa ecclesiirivi]|uniref:hypothetical protein n=1 Tax=Aquirufa ecclesiirivi TaxID=2715124 RepID=UPI0023D876A2|nr:hypothetical protein [Aquirufa ecclesiirivi]MDF0694709.1 hypothetical protein [Aquirufa ecclesiirivi]